MSPGAVTVINFLHGLPEIEMTSVYIGLLFLSTLAGGFFTIGSPRKPLKDIYQHSLSLLCIFFMFFLAVLGHPSLLHRLFSSCRKRVLLSSRGMQASHYSSFFCDGFSCCRTQALSHAGFSSLAHGLRRCSSQALEHRLNSCGAQAQCSTACGIFLDRETSFFLIQYHCWRFLNKLGNLSSIRTQQHSLSISTQKSFQLFNSHSWFWFCLMFRLQFL